MAALQYKHKNSPLSLSLDGEIAKARNSIQNFSASKIKDASIPTALLQKAQGIAFLTVAKAGFLFAGRIGTGLVVSKLPDGQWSAPCAIGTLGMSWGALVGGEITDFVLLLNTEGAVRSFMGAGGQVHLGAELGVALGPVGRTGAGGAALGTNGAAPIYSYSHSRGLYGGLSLEGAFVKVRHDLNKKFYGRSVTPSELLTGQVYPPAAAEPLYRAIADAVDAGSNAAGDKSSTGAWASDSHPSTTAH